MPTKYRFIPLYGANNFGPMCSILEIEDVGSAQLKLTFRFEFYWTVDGTDVWTLVCSIQFFLTSSH